MTLHEVKIKLPGSVMIPLKNKFKVRRMSKWVPLLFHIRLIQGMTWFPFMPEDATLPV